MGMVKLTLPTPHSQNHQSKNPGSVPEEGGLTIVHGGGERGQGSGANVCVWEGLFFFKQQISMDKCYGI